MRCAEVLIVMGASRSMEFCFAKAHCTTSQLGGYPLAGSVFVVGDFCRRTVAAVRAGREGAHPLACPLIAPAKRSCQKGFELGASCLVPAFDGASLSE